MSAAEAYADEARASLDEAQAYEDFLVGLSASVASAWEKVNKIPSIDELMRDQGITPFQDQALEDLAPCEFSDAGDGGGRREFAEGLMSRRVARRDHIFALARAWAGDGRAIREFAAPSPRATWSRIQQEIGVPGTRVVDGRINVEPNARLRPTAARGYNSLPGEYEELQRVDAVTYRNVNEVNSLICGAAYDWRIPQPMPGLEAVVRRADRMIQAALDAKWKEDCATFTYRGFAVSEPIWETKSDGFIGIHKCKFREQSTTSRWHFDERGSDLVGVELQGLADGRFVNYVLPRGETPESARMIVVNIGATGNNVEGCPATRPSVGISKLQQLTLQNFGISYQRFGVPLMKVGIELVEDLLKIVPAFGGMPKAADIQKTVNRLDNMRSRVPSTLPLQPGITIDYMSPLRDMPDPLPMLRYLDELKAMAWTNEGATLGRNNFGSYAMALSADNKFMRAAPHYALQFVKAYDELMRLHILWNYPDAHKLDLFPCYQARFAGTQDASKWISDIIAFWACQPWTMPEAIRRQAAALFGLAPDCFDNKPRAVDAVVDAVGELGLDEQQSTALLKALKGAEYA